MGPPSSANGGRNFVWAQLGSGIYGHRWAGLYRLAHRNPWQQTDGLEFYLEVFFQIVMHTTGV